MSLKVPTVFTAIDKVTAPMRAMGRSVNRYASTTEVAMARANRSVRRVNRAYDNLSRKIFNLRNAAVVAFAAVGVKKMLDMATATAKAGDEIAKTSRQIGILPEALQEFRFAADRQGVSNEVLTKSFQLLNRNIGDVQLGQGTLTTLLNRNNPALLEQLKGVKNNTEAFEVISDAISKMPNQLQKAALAQAAFGRSGQDMLKLLEAGPDGIAALRKEARKYGGVMSNDAALASEKFVDAQTNMNFALQGLRVMVGTQLMPVVQKYIERITDWVVNNRELIQTKVQEYVAKIERGITLLVANMDNIIRVVKFATVAFLVLRGSIFLMNASMAIAKGAMFAYHIVTKTATAAQWLLNAALSANPIGLVIVAIGALIGLVVLIVRKWESWGAAISVFLGPLGLAISLFQSFRKNWEMIVSSFRTDGIIGGLKAIGKTIIDALLFPIQQLLTLLSKVVPKRLGGNAIANAAQSIQDLRVNMGTESADTPAVNPRAAQQEAFERTLTERQQKNVMVDFKNVPKGVNITGDDTSSVMPSLTPSFSY